MSKATNLLGRIYLTNSRGQLVSSLGSKADIQYIKQSSEPLNLPCFNQIPALTNAQKAGQVIVDHLAFSIPLSSFKNLERAGAETTKKYRWHKMPSSKSWSNIEDVAARQKAMEKFNTDSWDALFDRMKQFTAEILGLTISAPRDIGFQGYQNSYRLLDAAGRIELGFVGVGGNNNTVHFQISGTGCKHVFDNLSSFVLHFWLAKVLQVSHLTRIDLAYDDFDGNFDCEYAIKAYQDNAFQGFKGGPVPKMSPCPEYQGSELVGYIVKVGSRKSNTYWRIYDKAAEQGLKGQVWYRSEVELKSFNVDALINPALAFAGLNPFSASINIEHGSCLRTSVKRAALDMAGRIRWARQQCGRTLSDILETFGGDIFTAFGALCDERGGKFSIPDTQSRLLNTHIREIENYENANNWL